MEPWDALLAAVAAVVLLAAGLFGMRRAERGRAGDPLGVFLRHFARRGVPPEVAHAAYGELRGWLGATSGHRVAPDDDLQQVYGVMPDERREAVELVARACGRAVPLEAAIPADLTRVDGLVRWVARCPEREAP